MDSVPMLSDSLPFLVDDGDHVLETLTADVEEAVSGVTDVQLPFSLPDHDVEHKDTVSDAPLLVRCPRGGLLRLGFASCDLAGRSWRLLPSSAIVLQLPADFAGVFDKIHSGGGLVLMEKFAKQEYHLVVSNPTSKAQRQLPQMMEFSKPEILGIFVDPTTASYKIPVIHCRHNVKEMDLVLMQEYDSISNSWEFAGQWRNRYQVEPIGAVYVKGSLFFLTSNPDALKCREQRVYHIYYLNDCKWERLELPAGLQFPAIFEYEGRLMLVGSVPDYDADDSSTGQSVCIWRQEWSLMSWTEVCNMPGPWVDELLEFSPMVRRSTLEAITGGNFVCIASSNGKVTRFDMARNDWAWLSTCDLQKNADGDRLFILERKPDTPV